MGFKRDSLFAGTSESSSATISARFGPTAGARFLSSRSGNERIPAAISYSGADRFRGSNNNSISMKDEEDSKLSAKFDTDDNRESSKTPIKTEEDETNGGSSDTECLTLMTVTRGTSPTSPASSFYVRSRRAEVDIVHQKETTRPRKLPDTMDEETQCDRTEETSKFSRFGGGRVSGAPWLSYLDKYSGATSGSSSVYTSRGFGNASSPNARLGSYVYARTNEAQTTARHDLAAKEPSSSGQEPHSSFGGKSHSEVSGGSSGVKVNNEGSSAPEEPRTPSAADRCQDSHGATKELDENGAQIGERCSCNARKTATSKSGCGSPRTSSQDLVLHRRENSSATQESRDSCEDRSNRQSPATGKCDEYNQRRPSIPRLGHGSSKGETKVSKSSSKIDSASPRIEEYERKESISKSDVSCSSRTDESLRIVEGFCQDQKEQVVSHKRDVAQRKDSTSR